MQSDAVSRHTAAAAAVGMLRTLSAEDTLQACKYRQHAFACIRLNKGCERLHRSRMTACIL